MDSFLRETARLNPPPLASMVRTVMIDFSFADGTFVPSRNWVGVPQYPLMRDSNIWPDGKEFKGFRFAGSTEESDRFTHPSRTFPFWGSVRQSW